VHGEENIKSGRTILVRGVSILEHHAHPEVVASYKRGFSQKMRRGLVIGAEKGEKIASVTQGNNDPHMSSGGNRTYKEGGRTGRGGFGGMHQLEHPFQQSSGERESVAKGGEVCQ